MTAANKFTITNGVLGFALVDKAAVGYLDAWQSPGGKKVDAVTIADYTDSPVTWACQVTTASIDPTAQNNDLNNDATWCIQQSTTPNPGATSFTITGTYFQDLAVTDDSLFLYLYANDIAEAFFYLGLAGDHKAPAAIGRCKLQATQFAGAGQVPLTSALSIPLMRRYDVWTGTGAGNVWELSTGTIRPGVGAVAATGATAGIPGTFTPGGSTPPANVAGLTGLTASPNTAWTVGQYVQTATAGVPGRGYWNGTTWTAGAAP